MEDEPGWARSAPPLAVEYADTGQDEDDLQTKIRELLHGGSRHVWVVRLTGPRRVEVHEPGAPLRVARPGDELRAPGILRNAVPVLALFDRKAAHEVALRNLLQRKGYDSLDSVRAEGEARGRAEGEARGRAEGEARGRAEGEARGRAEALLRVLAARKLPVSPSQRRAITGTTDHAVLDGWLAAAVHAASVTTLLRSAARTPRPSARAARSRARVGAPRKKR